MIYIFKACGAILSLPAACCSAVAKGLNECCAGCGGCCQSICAFFTGACSGLSKSFSRPLGCYVFVAVLMMTLSLIGVGNAFVAEGPYLDEEIVVDGQNVTACEEANEVKAMLGISGFMAFIHILFALYLQTAVWQGLVVAAEKEEAKLARQAAGGRKKPVPMADLILSASGTIFLHNIAFCIYFFVLPADFVRNYLFTGMVAPADKEGCDPDGWASVVSTIGMVFPLSAVLWAFNWVFFLYCHGFFERFCPCGNLCFGKRPQAKITSLPAERYSTDSDDSWDDEY